MLILANSNIAAAVSADQEVVIVWHLCKQISVALLACSNAMIGVAGQQDK